MATLYKSNGEIIENIEPANGRRFTLEELYKLLNCDTVPKATRIFHSCERMNIWDWIAGDALVCTGTQF